MFKFLPQNTKFFDYFDRDTEVLIRAAECFRQFLESSGDPKEYSTRLKELEHEADGLRTRRWNCSIALLSRRLSAATAAADSGPGRSRRLSGRRRPAHRPLRRRPILPKFPRWARSSSIWRMPWLRPFTGCAIFQEKIVRKHCIEIERLENQGDHFHHVAWLRSSKATCNR